MWLPFQKRMEIKHMRIYFFFHEKITYYEKIDTFFIYFYAIKIINLYYAMAKMMINMLNGLV